MADIITNILKQIKEAELNPKDECKLPQNAYYLDDDKILCKDRDFGVSRFPYTSDGLILWAYSNGIIEACESTFHIFKPLHYSEEPSVNFFGGIKTENGDYIPVALFENSRQLNEQLKIDRYVVYTNQCAYYIADTDRVTFSLRIHTDVDKHIHFSFNALNKSKEQVSIYMFSLFDALLRNAESDNFWDRMHKYAFTYEKSYLLNSYGDYMVVNRKTQCPNEVVENRTVGKSDIFGNRKSVINSPVLKTGKFLRNSTAVNTTNLPVAADIFTTVLLQNESIRCEYDLSYYHNRKEAEEHLNDAIDTVIIDAELDFAIQNEKKEFDNLKIKLGDWKGNVNVGLLNKFLRTIQKQVSVCALGKNYAGSLIGIRDVMQQLEGSLMWQPKESREKIINALNYVLEDGRAPRQFSVPETADRLPKLDLKEYIDQGVWIISTLYTYLAYTDDYSILDEKCSYYVVDEANTKVIKKSDICDTVFEHLIRIMDFLSSNIDSSTGCLRALYGDWNDAIDALGKTEDKDEKFGSGVSVMASLQFYQNCNEMIEILEKTGRFTENAEKYKTCAKTLKNGLLKYAVDVNKKGEKRILHGWGDKRSYKIGSFNDPDGVSRISSISNSFWIISDMIKNDLSLKETIVNDINKLTSKYGLLTFDKAFDGKSAKFVGRISTITKGTYENEASYVHAALFAGCALFKAGHGKRAWEEFEKSIIISHNNCNMTPFVMPNSYCYNPEYCIDGESMGDWYTGSGTVVLKEMVKYGFGVNPTLNGLSITMPDFLNFDNAELQINIKNKKVKVLYKNENTGKRKYFVNSQLKTDLSFDEVSGNPTLYIPNEDLFDGIEIKVID